MCRTADIHWLAGFLEGEGSFGKNNSGVPQISATSTDLDVVRRMATIVGGPVYDHWHGRNAKPHWKRAYRCVKGGNATAGWMMTLYPLMGLRRRLQIEKVLKQWMGRPPSKVYQFRRRQPMLPQFADV